MNECPSIVLLSMHADDALAPAAARELGAHLEGCAACRARGAALAADSRALRDALAVSEPVRVPELTARLGARAHAVAALALLAAGAYAAAFWSAALDSIPPGLRWLLPLDLPSAADLCVDLILYLANEGNAMFTAALQTAAALAALVVLALAARTWGARRAPTVLLLLPLCAALAPALGHALEIRRADLATLQAGERVDDTLVAIGETVAIDGDVDGDLLAFARRVTIRGRVTGNVVSAAETVEVQGSVGGSLFGFGREVSLAGAHVDRNVFGFGRDVGIGTASEVGGNAVTFGANVDVDGTIGTDLLSFASGLAVRGTVQRNVETFGRDVTMLPSARIGGDVVVHVGADDDLQVASGATVGGNVDRRVVAERRPENRYVTTSFYVRQALRLGAAFVTGLLLLWIFPALRALPIDGAGAALRAGAIGLVTAIVLPVAALIALVTIIGIPLAVIGFVLWLLGLYFAKTVVAQWLGRRLFRAPHGLPHYAATLFAGLVIVVIAINLPFVGWLVNFLLTMLGLGLLVEHAALRRGAAAARD